MKNAAIRVWNAPSKLRRGATIHRSGAVWTQTCNVLGQALSIDDHLFRLVIGERVRRARGSALGDLDVSRERIGPASEVDRVPCCGAAEASVWLESGKRWTYVLMPFWIVLNGAASVPALESLPVVDT
jgi:hypothetical protein